MEYQFQSLQISQGARIFYHVTGAGKPLILLHGLSSSSLWWSQNFPNLSDSNQVYAVDLVGFGRSRGQQ